MKQKSIITTLLILLVSTIGFSQARVQIIHNSADEAAEFVDIYVNDALFQDDFKFRTSTGFLDVPSGVNLKIDVAPGNSTSSSESLYTLNATLTEGEKYLLVANGLLASGPDEFQIYIYDMAKETSAGGNTDVIVFHGATDAPVVDVYESALVDGTIINDMAYGEFRGYLELQTLDYRLEVRDETGSVTVASYEAPLQTLGLDGTALTVLASGFLNPNENQAAFGLFVALPTGGDFVQLPVSKSNVQVIHNSSDPAAELVDVYLNGEILLDDFAFRSSTPFVELNAGVVTQIDIAPYTSSDAGESIYTLSTTLNADNNYILVANGILGSSGPDEFQIYAYDMAKETAMSGNTDVLVFHGATDAPTVDVYESSIPAGTIVDDLAYADFAGYLELQTIDYRLEIRDETGTVTVASYEAPLQSLGLDGIALTVLASGFLNPGENEASFGLFVALPSGGELVELPVSISKVQVIHNSADINAELVDVYLNGEILLDDFAFRSSTPFVDLKAGVMTQIDIAPYTSNSVSESLYTLNAALNADNDYILIANGMIGASGDEAFDIYIYDMAKETAMSGNTDVLVFHGATDAPTVDVYESSIPAGTIVDDLAYGDFAGYLELQTLDYILDIQDETGSVTVARYEAPLQTLGLDGIALTVLASGFLNPVEDEAAFGLFVSLPAGGELVELPAYSPTALNEIPNSQFSVYPNPATDFLNIKIENESNGILNIFNIAGQMIYSKQIIQESDIEISLSDFNSGIYIVELRTENGYAKHKLQITK